jgi:phosphoribosylformylglycinamidine (FGAM) synthase PurS component
MDIILYVFLLENNKYFLHPSPKDYKQNLFTELEVLYDYVTVNKPLTLIESYYIFDVIEIDKHVKEYMIKYGIQNVRGGSYIELELPEYKVKSLESEFNINENYILKRSALMNTIIEKYKNMDGEHRNIEQEKLKKAFTTYRNIKQDYTYYGTLSTSPMLLKIDRKLLFYYEWLNEYIMHSDVTDPASSKEIKGLYKETMYVFKRISALFFERFPDYALTYNPMLHYQRPDVVFDRIFLHKRYFFDWEESLRTAIELYKKFEFMYYKLLNYLDELEFDMTTYSEKFEQETQLSIKYLDTLRL